MGSISAIERLHLGTRDGVLTFGVDEDGTPVKQGHVLAGQAVRGIASHPDDPDLLFIACGLRGWGLHLSEDGGKTAQPIGFEDRWVWDVIVDPVDPDTILVGTEPPGLFRGHRTNGTWSFEEYAGIHDLPSRSRWTFFHEPFRAGHVHGIARSEARPGRIVAGVEHGALLLTHDDGRTWAEALVGYDVHRVSVHPEDPDTLYVSAGNGLHVSHDSGQTWEAVPGLRGKYIHAIVFAAGHPRTMVVYVDSSRCPLYRTDDGGDSWCPIGEALPASRPADPVRMRPGNCKTLFYAGDTGTDTSTLYRSADGGDTWSEVASRLPKVWRMHVTGA
jgi:photosystem II stability/assembly factor-like uncharacterized protein